MAEPSPDPDVAKKLAAAFEKNGYVRWPNLDRRSADGCVAYKKGFEVRIVADSLDELQVIRDWLTAAGFRPGRPFGHARQWRQPLYGRATVMRFLALIGWPADTLRDLTEGYS